MSNYFKNI